VDKSTNSDQTNQKTRSKLTLRLKVPGASDPKVSDPKVISNKNAENKRISNSLVQVTIKGRKKDPSRSDSQTGTRDLSKSEFEARQAAISNLSKEKDVKEKDFDVLSKIKRTEKAPEEQEIKLDPEEIISDQKEEKAPEQSQKVYVPADVPVDVPADVPVESPAESKTEEVVEPKVEIKKKTVYQVDNFDVRGKIKKSIEDQKALLAEREKATEEKKKVEQEKVETIEKKKPKKVKVNKFAGEEDKSPEKKGKSSDFKKEKFNSRRMLKTFIVDDEDGSRYRRGRKKKNQAKESKEYAKIINEVILPELISVSDLSERMAEKTGDVVKRLFTMGMVATSNQVIDADTAELIIQEFGHTVKRVKDSDVEDVINVYDDENVETLSRAPVVTIMGHVDHGKTSLLDAIRSTDIVGGESGGITQHIGASRVKTKSGKYITFLDTPGHEAFTKMRSRGADATDIVILVVAADDGVKQQTVEAINHAKAAEVPIIVAVNKIDKPAADSSKVKNELLSHNIVPEEMGGDVMFVEVSAKQRLNLDKLEEAILLQAEMMDLKAPYGGKSSGVVVETKVDQSKGVMATMLVQRGTVKIGDIIVVGTAYGKVRKMNDDHGKNLKEATPSMPVEILGLDSAPDAGDTFVQVDEEKKARDIISYRDKKKRDERSLQNTAKSADEIFKQAGAGKTKYLPIILKGDVHGSVEAISGSLVKLNTEEVAIKIVHSATGGIIESDVSLAEVAGAIIIAFNVRANAGAKDAARDKNVDIRSHSIIYNVVDELKLILGGMLEPIKTEEFLGTAEIRQVFKVSGAGKIAGSNVTSGTIKKGSKVRLLREDVVIYDGSLKTLKRFKEDVKEVKNGFECGIALENYDDIKESDIVECYEIVEQKRTL
jgi:translation initiation factor IF-2